MEKKKKMCKTRRVYRKRGKYTHRWRSASIVNRNNNNNIIIHGRFVGDEKRARARRFESLRRTYVHAR